MKWIGIVSTTLLIGVLVSNSIAETAPGLQPEVLDNTIISSSDEAGNVDLRVFTNLGYTYEVEQSADLGATPSPDAWSQIWSAYGLGHELALRVYDAPPPPPGNPNPPPPIPSFSFHLMEMAGSGDIVVSWMDGGSDFSIVISETLPESNLPIWQQRIDDVPLAAPDGDYTLTIYAFWVVYDPDTMPPVNPPPLGANDPTLKKLTDVWDDLDPGETFTGGGGSSVSSGDRDYYRVRVNTPDSDGDGLFDWQEFLPGCNSNPFLADTDGDGFNDLAEKLAGTDAGDFRIRPYDSAHPPAVADIWVDAGADLGGFEADGSKDLPFPTILEGIEAAAPGDLVGVRAGDYEIDIGSSTYDLQKPLQLVAVDGPKKTILALRDDEANVSIRVSNPDFKGGIYTSAVWSHGMATVGAGEELSADPMTVQFHGFRIVGGYKAPAFFVLPGVRMVFANCYLNSLLCGLAECHSSEITVLNCQIAECGDGDNFTRHAGGSTLPPGIIFLRGKSMGEFWHCSMIDNVKEEDHGTIHLIEEAGIVMRNSILWEADNDDLGGNEVGDYSDPFDNRRSRVLTVADEFGNVFDPIKEDSEEPAPFDNKWLVLDLFDRLDVQSTVLFTAQVPHAPFDPPVDPFPSPAGGGPNPEFLGDSFFLFDEPYEGSFEDIVRDLRTRRLSYEEDFHGTLPMDGVTSPNLDTSAGTLGPAGFEHLLRYDLIGHARHPAYREAQPPNPPLTACDLGAVEVVPTLRDDSIEIQRPWTDVSITTAAAGSFPRLAVTGPHIEGFTSLPPGRLMTINETVYGKSFEQTSLALDGLGGSSTIAAVCYDPAAGRIFAFGDQRRGGRPKQLFEQAPLPGVSMHRGCAETLADHLGLCLHADYLEEPLRGCFQTIPQNLAGLGSPTLRKAPANLNLGTFLASGNSSDSPTAFQESVGLRDTIRDKLRDLSSATPAPYNSLKPVDGYPDGLMIAFNTLPKFGEPVDGTSYSVGEELFYDGGGLTGEEGEIIEVHLGGSAGDTRFEFDTTSHLNLQSGERREFFFRAWPFHNGTNGREYGPALDASVVVDGDNFEQGDGTLDPQPFPLVINEVMSGTGGWVEIFNTWDEEVSGSILSGVVLKAHNGNDPDDPLTAQRDLSSDVFPPRSVKVIAISPGAGELQFSQGAAPPTRIEDEGNVRIDIPGIDDNFDPRNESFIGRNRLDGTTSEGRAWDGEPRGEFNNFGPHDPNEGAAFASAGSNPLQPSSRGASNTADYTDTYSSAPVRQPYFQAIPNTTATTVWLCWRHPGHLGAVWDGDGLRHDFVATRLEGSAYQGGTIYTGLRTPLTKRKDGDAIVVKVPASGVLAGAGENWTTQAGTTHQLDLDGQGIRAIQWCAEVDGTGKFLIIGGPPSTERAGDHPSVGRFSLWSGRFRIFTSPPHRRSRPLRPLPVRRGNVHHPERDRAQGDLCRGRHLRTREPRVGAPSPLATLDSRLNDWWLEIALDNRVYVNTLYLSTSNYHLPISRQSSRS